MQIVQVGIPRQKFEVHSAVVYERESGRIVHVHQIVRPTGRKKLAKRTLEKIALEHAARAGHTMGALAALGLGARELDPMATYRVDPRKRAFLTAPSPPRRPRAPRTP